MVVREFAGMSGETEVADSGHGNVGVRRREGEAFHPFIRVLVRKLQAERFILEVGEFCLGRAAGGAETTGLFERVSF